jgi:predicted transposase/invertase (TIGR01784 family)
MKTDTLFYRLMQAQPTLAFELAGLAVPAPEGYGFISQEIKQTAFRLDGIAEPPADSPEAPRGYIEVQFQPDMGFYPRFFGEILLHLEQYPTTQPWQAVVVYPSQAVERVSPATTPFMALPNLHRVYLDRLPLLDSSNPRFWLVALIIAKAETVTSIVGKIQARQRSQPDYSLDWPDLLETVLVYKLPNFTREEIQKMLEFANVSLKETRFYQDVLTEGEAAMLLRQLERKFRPLPESARQRVQAADAETLLIWGERVLDANSLDEVWGN